MLDDKFLEEWVPILVPKEYGPDRKLENNKPLLCITIYSAEEMDKYKNDFYPDAGSDVVLRGHILDMGGFMKYADVAEYKKFLGRYLIKLNASMSAEEAIFALLHEVGHLHGFVTNSKKHIEDPDEFADNYALKKAKELIDEPILRMKVIFEGLDNDFKHR